MKAQRISEILLKPPEVITFQGSHSFEAGERSERDLVIVGKASSLAAAAKEVAASLDLPVLARQAEEIEPGYAGKKVELPCLIGGALRKVTLVALPEKAGRYVTSVRSDALAKLLHGGISGKDVLLAVSDDEVVAAGLAVGRCVSPYTGKTKEREPSRCRVAFYGCSPPQELLEKLTVVTESIRMAQGLTDMPPNEVYPTTFKEFALEAVKGLPGVTASVIEGEELRAAGYGLITAVGQCAVSPPCLLVLTHVGSRSGLQGAALVGKGITFDTGGAALKSREGMCGMKRDMGGAAGCFGAFLAMAKMGGLPSGQPLHCVLCLAENAIGSKAFVQDDILTCYSGLTVEINNTDAEGRLVLGDGVAHVAKHLDCELVADMATLTGAQGVSTGSHHASILATDEGLEADIVAAGRASGDLVHPGIFAPELLTHEFDSKFADMKNSVKNRMNAQSSCAGLFIYKHLVHAGYTGRWLHMDMAYPVHEPLGDFATGWGVGLLCKYFGAL